MRCSTVQASLSAYVDGYLPEETRAAVGAHLAACRPCALRYEELVSLRRSLRSFAPVRPPLGLRTELQILASRERVRAEIVASFGSRVSYWRERLKLSFDNLMRPLAVPFAGGLASAVFLFSTLMPTLGFHRDLTDDVTLSLYQEAGVGAVPELVSSSRMDDDTVVEVEIDSQGRVRDFHLTHGRLTGDVGNMILFTTYTPATFFRGPAYGKVILRRSRISVKG